MAEANIPLVDPERVTPLLECSICLEPYTNPLVLPCLHTFCSSCLDNHVTTTQDGDGRFQCPTCRLDCVVPEGGVNVFPKNFLANCLKDIMPTPVTENVPSCDRHPKQKVDWYCKTCECPACPKCILKEHKTHDTEELDAAADYHRDNSRKEAPASFPKRVPSCDRHPNHKVDWYCKTCKVPACSDCILDSHSIHDKEKLSVVAAPMSAPNSRTRICPAVKRSR